MEEKSLNLSSANLLVKRHNLSQSAADFMRSLQFFLFVPLCLFLDSNLCFSQTTGAKPPERSSRPVPKSYPSVIRYDSLEFQRFATSYNAFKKKYDFSYLNEVYDSVGCTINQLAYAIKPIVLNYQSLLKNKDTTAAILKAIRLFIDENTDIFNTKSSEILLNSIVEENGYRSVLFECCDYAKGYRLAGKSKGMIEFVINHSGEIGVLVSTSIRRAPLPTDTVLISPDQITKSLLYRSFHIDLNENGFSYTVDRIDVVKVKRVCVYEVRKYDDITNEDEELIERRLRSSEVHLAYEVDIDIGYKKPIVVLYIDGFTGKELGIDYPFLE